MNSQSERAFEQETIDQIAERVIEALRDDLALIVEQLSAPPTRGRQLTVEEVAERLSLARSTVYAHWREWGGYKLGRSEKAPIRFNSDTLPNSPLAAAPPETKAEPKRPPRRHRRPRRDLLADSPRLVRPVDELA